MGYTVYHDGQLAAELDAALQLSVAQAAPSAPEPAPPPHAPVPGPAAARSAETRRRPPVSTPDTAPDAAPSPVRAAAAGSGTRQPAVRLPDRLQIALLRASGCNPNDPATQAVMDSWPLDQLRRDPAAKRALWPVLRALRRQARQ
ncbi:hypothetical protein [Stenotrophomonas sp. 24(2023)]|uniref:hypothetical protein n=1 Tax=Stenotrophomonas sp. 24(2023) TaxID=3068324 RepID=UPI0027E154A4|nr:hypothetical protein [Stenotrophomonas sp. 24(2023)]WMJ71473.1 hypothetical protein Q9R17_11070 [Stenotrophomonas sp. 24(2023)]